MLPPSHASGKATASDGKPGGEPPAADVEMKGPARPAAGSGGVEAPPTTWMQRVEGWVRRSPPFTVSLSVHILALLLLALCVVRVQQTRHAVLDLSFAKPKVEQPQPGMLEAPVAPPTPVVVPEPVTIESPEPVTPDPVAKPRDDAPVPPADEGHSAPAGPAIGSLLSGRDPGRRETLLATFGGSGATEAAVARALDWLKRTQGKDGLWSLKGRYSDGAVQENRVAATAMALLAFQGAGHTTTSGSHAATVKKAWEAVRRWQAADGKFVAIVKKKMEGGAVEDVPEVFDREQMYAHAQATIAACELAGVAGDETSRVVAERALGYVVFAQGQDGGWRYQPGAMRGDLSLTGWFMMALKSGEMAGISVEPRCYERVNAFLDSVAFENGARYGYMRYAADTQPIDDSSAVSAEGLLSRQFLGWRRDDPRLASGVARQLTINLPLLEAWGGDVRSVKQQDAYAWYYLTQVVHHRGGDDWRQWNDVMREVLPKTQVKKGRDAGSWDPNRDHWGHVGGRLFMTCFCTYMLEVYYRHLPLYGDEALAAAPATQPR